MRVPLLLAACCLCAGAALSTSAGDDDRSVKLYEVTDVVHRVTDIEATVRRLVPGADLAHVTREVLTAGQPLEVRHFLTVEATRVEHAAIVRLLERLRTLPPPVVRAPLPVPTVPPAPVPVPMPVPPAPPPRVPPPEPRAAPPREPEDEEIWQLSRLFQGLVDLDAQLAVVLVSEADGDREGAQTRLAEARKNEESLRQILERAEHKTRVVDWRHVQLSLDHAKSRIELLGQLFPQDDHAELRRRIARLEQTAAEHLVFVRTVARDLAHGPPSLQPERHFQPFGDDIQRTETALEWIARAGRALERDDLTAAKAHLGNAWKLLQSAHANLESRLRAANPETLRTWHIRIARRHLRAAGSGSLAALLELLLEPTEAGVEADLEAADRSVDAALESLREFLHYLEELDEALDGD